jgi:hypothetical protein
LISELLLVVKSKTKIKFKSAGTVDYTGGAINKTSFFFEGSKHKAVKLEAHPISYDVGG